VPIEIVYPSEKYIKSFHQTLDQVAKEQIYIEMIEAKPYQEVAEFQLKLINNNWPVYYAINNNEVVGWADVTPSGNPRLAHRGFLGMGLLKSFRRKGLGTQLLKRALDHAKKIGLEKVELMVYTNNDSAINLYKKCGFTDIGVIRHYRKLNGQYFDCLEMEMFL
jgi:RimJ/RimL family protein N-acetyltransferase